MENDVLDIILKKSVGKLDEGMKQMGYNYVGQFLYDYPPLPHKWSERIRTEMYKKEGEDQFWYFMGVPTWNGDNVVSIRIGKVEKQSSNNPEYMFK